MNFCGSTKNKIGIELPFALIRKLSVLVRLYIKMKRIKTFICSRTLLICKICRRNLGKAAIFGTDPGNVTRQQRYTHSLFPCCLNECTCLFGILLEISPKIDLIHAMLCKKSKPLFRNINSCGILTTPPPHSL